MGLLDQNKEILKFLRKKLEQGGEQPITVPRLAVGHICELMENLFKILSLNEMERAQRTDHQDSSFIIPEDEADTYDGWKARGRGVKKGEKSTGRNGDGVPTFKVDQTQIRGENYAPRGRPHHQDRPWQEDDDGKGNGFMNGGHIPEDDGPPF